MSCISELIGELPVGAWELKNEWRWDAEWWQITDPYANMSKPDVITEGECLVTVLRAAIEHFKIISKQAAERLAGIDE